MKTIIILIFGLSIWMSFGVGETEIKGFVKNNSDSPLIGVNVLVKGTTNGTITDIGGGFSIRASIGQTLYISSTGYESKEVEITKKMLNITLDETLDLIDEVVVGHPQRESMFKKVTSLFRPKVTAAICLLRLCWGAV